MINLAPGDMLDSVASLDSDETSRAVAAAAAETRSLIIPLN